jgi:two-component system, cell cycle response regulator DivK
MEPLMVRPVELVLVVVAALLVGAVLGFLLRGWLAAREQARRWKAREALRSARSQATVDPPAFNRTDRERGVAPAPHETWAPPRSPHPTPPAPSTPTTGTGPVVLIVDDRFELRAVNGAYLAGHGYRVVEASDGEEALEAVKRQRPDAILLDHSMPRRTGLEVVQELKADPATATIPIIFMTAHSYGAVGRSAMAAGCSAYLPKPCDPSRVLQEIARQTGTAMARA